MSNGKFERLIIDRQYVQLVGNQLLRFGKTTSNCHMARCPACGDSKKSESKRRLCFVEKDMAIFIYCQNCNLSWNMEMFIHEFFPEMEDLYKKELFKSMFGETKKDTISISKSRIKIRDLHESEAKEVDTTQTGVNIFDLIEYMYPAIDLNKDSNEYKYLAKRGFTYDELKYLFVTKDFKLLASKIDNKIDLSKLKENDTRLVIPFIDHDTNTVYAIQGRSFNPKEVQRYITIKYSDDTKKIFTKEHLNVNDDIICVEGALDSLFIDNSIAANDSNLLRADADIYVWDNEPMNATTIAKIEKAIKADKTVCIWDFSPSVSTDINDMIKNYGFTKDELRSKIIECSCKGLMATYRLSQWKRI